MRTENISIVTWGGVGALLLLLGGLAYLLIGCDTVFKVRVPPKCPEGQVAVGDVCAPRYVNYYPCDCVCEAVSADQTFALAARVRVTADVNVRTADASGNIDVSDGGILGVAPTGRQGTITDGPKTADVGGGPEPFWKVDFDNTGTDGWVVQRLLAVLAPVLSKTLEVCVPPTINKNLKDALDPPDATAVANDCSTRVPPHVGEITHHDFTSDTQCTCGVTQPLPATNWDDSCDLGCPDPSGVCLQTGTDPEQPTPDGLTTALFTTTTVCEVTGTADVHVGDDSATTSARGLVQFHGRPCAPEQSCQVGVSYQFTFGDITIPVAFHKDPKFVDLSVAGASEPGALQLVPFGPTFHTGTLPVGTTLNSARGRSEGDPNALVMVGRNGRAVEVDADWVAKICQLAGALEDGSIVDDDGNTVTLRLSVSVGGHIINQPPHADAGPDQTVQCTSPQGATVNLSAAGSTDADNNIVAYVWRRGSETGPPLADPLFSPTVTTTQSLGDTTYYVRVVDSNFSVDSDSVKVSVVDTTAPTISCNAPSTIFPSDVPESPKQGLSFKATATDTCDIAPQVVITSFQCTKPASCKVGIQGDTITIFDSGGVGDVISWQAQATDRSGNTAQKSCQVSVVKK